MPANQPKYQIKAEIMHPNILPWVIYLLLFTIGLMTMRDQKSFICLFFLGLGHPVEQKEVLECNIFLQSSGSAEYSLVFFSI
jgi:hypothetical protein